MADERDQVTKSDDEWRQTLTSEQYRVLRKAGTERAFTGALWDEKRAGTYRCAGCHEELYPAASKFDSGTGWPSFWRPVRDEAVATRAERQLWMVRTEVHCARCGGHLGHVFPDGPPPTGQRHCLNSAALVFEPADGESGHA